MSVYLDYNASAPIDDRVLECMIDIYKNHIGNADSRTHLFGEDTRNVVEEARKKVAGLLNVNSDEVFFTSGATESNNIAIQGLRGYGIQSGKKHIVTTAIEHKAVLETVKHLEKEGFSADYILPKVSGRVNTDELLNHVSEQTLLVSTMHVNNETGIIQPVKEIGDELAKREVLFHVDATQSCGKLVEEIRNLKYDMLSFSAHKLMGPQGIGVLVLRKKTYRLPPVTAITYGGQQEHGIRPGTIPVALVAGCGKACELAQKEYIENNERALRIRNSILKLLAASGLSFSINGDLTYSVPGTLNICIHGVSSEALMISTKQYCGMSNGSACTSKSYTPSYVLTAMGVPVEQIESSVRISWGRGVDEAMVLEGFQSVIEMAKKMQ